MPTPLIDLTGKRFGFYVVIKRVENGHRGVPYWLCRCNCGTIKKIAGPELRKGKTHSCGCYCREKTIQRQTTHGESRPKTREFSAWSRAKERCFNPRNKDYR